MARPHHPAGNAGKGRPKGSPNKATRALKRLAQQYTAEAIDALAAVMRDCASPAAARVSPATALLDRGHGRPQQQIEHAGELDGAGLAPVVIVLPDNGRGPC